MKKLIILIGPSGTGKSTWAHNEILMRGAKECTVVGRDKIRELIYGYSEENVYKYYSSKSLSTLEKEVTKYETLLIKEALADNKTVIVDATHLTREYLTRFKFFNVPVELQFFDTDLETAIERDSKRVRKVGEDIIRKQFSKYKALKASLKDKPINFDTTYIKLDKTLPKAIICDIDGTIAHMNSGRSPYDWKRVGEDSVDEAVSEIVDCVNFSTEMCGDVPNMQDGKVFTIICTGRDGICEEESKDWCHKHGIVYEEFYIRKTGDKRPDWVVKEEMWRDIAKKYNIVALVDDREQVVTRARALGLKVLQVEYHNF